MASTRICKVCGKEYEYCHTQLKVGEIFRWQDVACCKEHGSQYFAEVMTSRNEGGSSPSRRSKSTNKKTAKTSAKEKTVE